MVTDRVILWGPPLTKTELEILLSILGLAHDDFMGDPITPLITIGDPMQRLEKWPVPCKFEEAALTEELGMEPDKNS